MNPLKTALIAAALLGSASATTIGIGGGTASSPFVTSTGVALTNANSTIAIGTYNGTIFTQFAAADATPMVIGTGTFAGKLTGNFSDNTSAATAFNGAIITFRISVNLGSGVTGVAYFSGGETGANFPAVGTKFPINGNGANDSLNYETRNLVLLGEGSTAGSQAYNGTNIVIGVVPEPSTALLGLLGIAGLIRRRR